MGKLLKYEFRKIRSFAIGLLVLTGIAEGCYLIGVMTLRPEVWKNLSDDWALAVGMIGLVLCTVVGVMLLGLLSVLIFHDELNKKQCYMLFMVPESHYKVLGAKLLENGISIAAAGALYGGLAALDLWILTLKAPVITDGMPFGTVIMDALTNWTKGEIFETIAVAFSTWLLFVVLAFFSVILQATYFYGKRASGWISFAIFIFLGFSVMKLMTSIRIPGAGSDAQTALHVIVALALSAIVYVVSGWFMERQLSV